MEHELGVDRKVGGQREAALVLLSVVRKLLAQPDQHSIQPPEHVGRVVDLRLEHRYPRHQHGRRLLVERLGDGRRAGLCKVSSARRHSQSEGTRRVLVVGHKLDQAGSGRRGLALGSDDLKVHAERSFRGERADLPGGCLSDSNLGFSNTRALFSSRDDMANHPRDLQILGGL